MEYIPLLFVSATTAHFPYLLVNYAQLIHFNAKMYMLGMGYHNFYYYPVEYQLDASTSLERDWP